MRAKIFKCKAKIVVNSGAIAKICNAAVRYFSSHSARS